jgi:DNA mismatch repair ATPase MutS
MDIKLYEKNAKIHTDKQLELLAKIVAEIGWRQSVEVNQEGVIVVGHGRYLARKRAYNNRKLKAILKVGEARCVRCGCDELDFLEFNHIGGNGCKDHRENKNVPIMDRILTKKRNTNDLEIVCRVCNALDFLERKNNKQSKRFSIKWE